MKYLILNIFIIFGIIVENATAKSINDNKPIYLTNIDIVSVKLDFNMAIYHQKQAYKLRRYMKYDPKFQPHILLINNTSINLKPMQYCQGLICKLFGDYISSSNRIHKVTNQKQLEYFMSGKFKVSRHYRNKESVYTVSNK